MRYYSDYRGMIIEEGIGGFEGKSLNVTFQMAYKPFLFMNSHVPAPSQDTVQELSLELYLAPERLGDQCLTHSRDPCILLCCSANAF